MRLAFLTHEPFYPPTGGGSAEALYLVREMVRRGHEVHLFGPPGEGSQGGAGTERSETELARELGVRLHPFRRWAMGRYTSLRSLKYVLYPWFLAREVEAVGRGLSFDVLFSQHSIAAVAAGGLKSRLGVPVVMNLLDYLTGFMETWPAWRMPRPVLSLLKRYELSLPRRYAAEAVLTVSDPLADRIVAAGFPRERVLPIYYGYDPTLFPYDAAAVQARRDEPPVVVMHGSLDHHHLGRIALEALAWVRASRPDVQWLLIGRETAALRRFRAMAEARGWGGHVVTPGFVPYAEVGARLARASVGLVPYEESTGVHCAFVAKAVEYLGVGLPVATTRLAGIARAFGQEPMVKFAGFSGDELGEQVLAWLGTPLAQRLAWSAPAAARVRAELDWQVISRRAVDRVEAVAGRAGGKR